MNPAVPDAVLLDLLRVAEALDHDGPVELRLQELLYNACELQRATPGENIIPPPAKGAV